MILKLKRTPGIYIVGFMASGKTTVGKHLAYELGWEFVDVDDDIEKAAGTSIKSIFEGLGEAEFRRIETEALRKRVSAIERGRPTVLALGGGAFVQETNYQLLENNGVSIWLDCPLDMVRARVAESEHRPLARDPEKLELLYDQRKPAYGRADFRIEVTGDDPSTVVERILRLPIF
jgi:shikimate kinase